MDEVAFKLYLIAEKSGKKKRRSVKTVELHLTTYKRLRRHCPDLSLPSISAFFLQLLDSGRKGSYINDYIDLLKIYGRFKGITDYDGLTYFPEEDFEKATMSDGEIDAFLSLPPKTVTSREPRTGGFKTYVVGEKRHNVMTLFWKILAYSGMRPGEVAHLTIDSVDFGRQIFLADGKTGKRNVPIADVLVSELQAYITSLETPNLFPSPRGGKTRQGGVINDVTWGYDFHERIKRLGIKRKNLTPYSLRHSFITRMLDEGVNLYPLQNLIGHKQGSEVTATYYHHTTKTLLKTIAKDPLGRKEMSSDERFKQFRETVRDALERFTTDISEERKFIMALLDNS